MGLEFEKKVTCLFVYPQILDDGQKSPWLRLDSNDNPIPVLQSVIKGKITQLRLKEVEVKETSKRTVAKQKLDLFIDDGQEIFMVRTGFGSEPTWFAKTLINALNQLNHDDFNNQLKIVARAGEGSVVFCNVYNKQGAVKPPIEETVKDEDLFKKFVNVSQMIDAANGRTPQAQISDQEIPF